MFRHAEIEIGKPEGGWLNTAIVIHQPKEYSEYLSENSVSYWCSIPEYGIDIKIGKASVQGIKLTKLIQKKMPVGGLKYTLLEMALPHLTPTQFVSIFDQLRQESLIEGANRLRGQINNLLREE